MDPHDTPGRRSPWAWLRAALVAAFVVWHLYFLLLRNPLDLWGTEIKGWLKERSWWESVEQPFQFVDKATSKYGNFTGTEQGWTMFASPLARSAPFLAARITFTDGSTLELRSPNEPADPAAFLRIGGWRQRKLEDYLVQVKPEDLAGHTERELWRAYVRWSVRRWRAAWPDDTRIPEHVDLVRRSIVFPAPGDDPSHFEPPEETVLGTFDPDGRLR